MWSNCKHTSVEMLSTEATITLGAMILAWFFGCGTWHTGDESQVLCDLYRMQRARTDCMKSTVTDWNLKTADCLVNHPLTRVSFVAKDTIKRFQERFLQDPACKASPYHSCAFPLNGILRSTLYESQLTTLKHLMSENWISQAFW